MLNYAKILEHVPAILDNFSYEYTEFPNRLSLPCPVHGGDKRDGCCIFTNSDYGLWKCWTNNCHSEYETNVVGFIHGILENEFQKKLQKYEVIKWIEEFTKTNFNTANPTDWNLKKESISIANTLNRTLVETTGISRNIVRQSLKIPAQFFINRGFSKEILDKYDIGLCTTPGKQFYQRVVAPVYNDEYTMMIGAIGRTLNPKCLICGKHHSNNESCSLSSYGEYQSSKWINSKGFRSEHHLFNYWMAKDFIKTYQTAILVEGTPDILRLEEAGIHIGLGLFGLNLSESQKIKLENTGAINIFIITNNDPPGIEGRYKIQEVLERMYNVIPVVLPKKDIAEMKIAEVKEFFKPILRKYIK